VPLQFVKGDIQCADLVRFVLETEQIDTVMHFAAQVGGWVDLALPGPLQRRTPRMDSMFIVRCLKSPVDQYSMKVAPLNCAYTCGELVAPLPCEAVHRQQWLPQQQMY
jgi:hypothetical protein